MSSGGVGGACGTCGEADRAARDHLILATCQRPASGPGVHQSAHPMSALGIQADEFEATYRGTTGADAATAAKYGASAASYAATRSATPASCFLSFDSSSASMSLMPPLQDASPARYPPPPPHLATALALPPLAGQLVKAGWLPVACSGPVQRPVELRLLVNESSCSRWPLWPLETVFGSP